MKTSRKDKVEGRIHIVKGGVKETVGEVTNDPYLKVEGKVEKAKGKAQEKAGQIKKVLGK